MIEAVVFDVGGTLHRSSARGELAPAIMREVLTPRESGRWSDDELLAAYKRSHKELRARYTASGERRSGSELSVVAREQASAWLALLGVEPTHAKVEAIMAAWEAHEPIDRYAPGAREALRALHGRGLALGIVSNTFRDHRISLRRDGLLDLFRTIVLSIEVGVWKPDRRLYEIATRELGIAPDRIVHVGDREDKDVVPAQEAGLRAILIGAAGFSGVLADLERLIAE